MKLVYTHESLTTVTHFYNLLEANDIAAIVKNQFLGGAAGELGLNDVWPELWVLDASQFDHARLLIKEAQRSVQLPQWCCHFCGEVNEGTFEICWQCQTMREDDSN